jgi:hypothetical protein
LSKTYHILLSSITIIYSAPPIYVATVNK